MIHARVGSWKAVEQQVDLIFPPYFVRGIVVDEMLEQAEALAVEMAGVVAPVVAAVRTKERSNVLMKACIQGGYKHDELEVSLA